MRFVSGLPHGAFFGVGSIVAERVADNGQARRGRVDHGRGHDRRQPLRRAAGNLYQPCVVTWRATFGDRRRVGSRGHAARSEIVGSGSARAARYGDEGAVPVSEKRSLRGWCWRSVMLGNGGIFCWYSYVSPLMVHTSGFAFRRPDARSSCWPVSACSRAISSAATMPTGSRPSGSCCFTLGTACLALARHLLRGACPLSFAGADVSDYGLPLLRIVAPATADPRKFARRRDARRGARAGGFQPGQRPGGLLSAACRSGAGLDY